MAQIERVPCEECGNIVASTSRLCPHCGSKGPNAGRNAFPWLIGGLLVVFYIGSVIVNEVKSMFGSSTTTNPTAAYAPAGDTASTSAGPAEPAVAEEPVAIEAADEEEPAPAAEEPAVDEGLAAEAQTTAIGKALADGEDAAWSAGGATGTVEIKSADNRDGRPCREYRTVRDDKRSAFSLVCQGTDQGWAAPS